MNGFTFEQGLNNFLKDIIKFAEAHMRRRTGIASTEELRWLEEDEEC